MIVTRIAPALRPLFATLFVICATLAPLVGYAQDPPDILFIAIDDLNDWVGPLGGHPQTKTPNIDRLAARGLTFANAHSPSAICNASRTALLTGLRPSTSGIYGNAPDWRTLALFEGKPTLPRFFKDNGYRTFGAGKIFHAHTFFANGFAGFNDTGAWSEFWPAIDRQLPDELKPPRTPVNRNPVFGGFDWSPVVSDDRGTGDGQIVAFAERQLVTVMEAPKFVAAGIFRPHLPWYVPQKYFDMHPLEDVELPEVIENDLSDVPPIARAGSLQSTELHRWVLESGTWQEAVQGYLASISFADAMVGRLIDALDRSGRADKTIIVLWGDHGFHLGEKARWRKMTLWEESTHVPLIVVVPGHTVPGSRSSRPVSLMDIYPTLAELTGLNAPDYLEGQSLVPLIEDPEADWDTPAVSTYGYENHAVRSERYRYVRHSDGTEELYDHDNDPNEWENLVDERRLRQTKRRLAEWLPVVNMPDASAN